MKTVFTLKIADILIRIQSDACFGGWNEDEKRAGHDTAFQKFFYAGKRKPAIVITLKVSPRLPAALKSSQLFLSLDQNGADSNWKLLKKGNGYLYAGLFEGRRQAMFIDGTFSRITAYLACRQGKSDSWRFDEIVYNFLQILLINYLSFHQNGLIAHAVAVKDIDANGYLFIGQSGAGKTTTARLWHTYSRAQVINDDRVIIKKTGRGFRIFGSPWGGEFPETEFSSRESFTLDKIFFIYHHPRNVASPLSRREAFTLLYPNMFPAFWDKALLERGIFFAEGVISRAACVKVGFVNDRHFIPFVRAIGGTKRPR